MYFVCICVYVYVVVLQHGQRGEREKGVCVSGPNYVDFYYVAQKGQLLGLVTTTTDAGAEKNKKRKI